MSKRGVIVGPAFEVDGGGGLTICGIAPDPVSLRRFLLYWDEIDFPFNESIRMGTPLDFLFLLRAGVARRTSVSIITGDIKSGFVNTPFAVLAHNNAREPGCWSIGQTSSGFYMPPEAGADARVIEVELYEALPAPPDDVPLADILEFKKRRATELGALRAALDELYLDVVNSADAPRSKRTAMDRLDRVLADLHKVASESWATRLIPSMQVALDIPQALSAAAAVAAVGLPLEYAGAAGAIGAMLRFDWGTLRKPGGLPGDLKPYAYLLAAKKELRP